MKHITINEAKEIAEKLNASHIVIFTMDKNDNYMQNITTYGHSKQDCIEAAVLGNKIKRDLLKWPEEYCNAKPTRL